MLPQARHSTLMVVLATESKYTTVKRNTVMFVIVLRIEVCYTVVSYSAGHGVVR
jgi:hypothetical protein